MSPPERLFDQTSRHVEENRAVYARAFEAWAAAWLADPSSFSEITSDGTYGDAAAGGLIRFLRQVEAA